MQGEEEAIHPLAEGRTPDEDEMSVPAQDEIEGWRTELQEIEEKLAHLNERKAMLQQVLETIPVIEKLRGNTSIAQLNIGQEMNTVTVFQPTADDCPKLVNAIPMVLEKFRKPMTPSQIKLHLKEVGFTREYGETYFYTAIKRAVEKRAIVKKRDGRYALVARDANGAAYGG
ncbi:hypothetical protein JDN40_03995 [Rhodomicrobium vannielii ATCC 17100]|uniref:hypothetical protein n=1 Tax=Rhodomicrobium vannielii TaxID=1069 RepID=UPI0019181972|nr:hypothetical protein [Rhodomicrobium vannielii]MBJ7533268.1 hypothetical protein [Rhodomicrobium vannielii ATCC 17100]